MYYYLLLLRPEVRLPCERQPTGSMAPVVGATGLHSEEETERLAQGYKIRPLSHHVNLQSKDD